MITEYKISDLIKYNFQYIEKDSQGVVIGFEKNELQEDVLMICWLDSYEVSKCHPSNVTKV